MTDGFHDHAGKLHGELYMDAEGKPHFICHTPATVGFIEAREGLLAFIGLLQDKVDSQDECPFHIEGKSL